GGAGRLLLAGQDLSEPLHHRPSYHGHVLEWTPFLRPAGREWPRGGGRACYRHEGSVARLKPRLHPIQWACIAGLGGSTMKTAIPKPLRCAIYTRKSTEHNLDLAFNSLDAQREACEAYIKSQAHEGWWLLPEHYDDGGLSGASLERPALQLLLTEVKEGRVDVIVVYKVDRLTRSLADFAKLVEMFDHHEVSFVSVTQSFNTTSSMGRLTLNV